MKSQEELSKLKQEYEALTEKLKELSDQELKQVIGGFTVPTNDNQYEIHIY